MSGSLPQRFILALTAVACLAGGPLLAQTAHGSEPARHTRAMSAANGGKGEDSQRLRLLAEQVRQNPNDGVLLARYGLSLVKAGRSDEGLSALSRAVVTNPDEPEILLLHSKGLLRAGHFDEAASEALKAVQSPLASREQEAEGFSVAGFAKWRQGNVGAAEGLLRKSVEKDRSNPRPFFNLGMLLYSSGRRVEGTRYLEEAAQIAPDDLKVLRVLSDLYERQGRADRALVFLQRAARILPNDAQLGAKIGVMYLTLGEPGKALSHFDRAVSLEPSNKDYHLAYATCLAKSGKWEEARRQAGIAEELGADVSAVRKLIAEQAGN